MKEFTALVTGANGFVGANLCKKLLERNVKVYAMVRKTSDLSVLKLVNPEPEFNKITLVYGDLNDYTSLLENVQGKDVIFNIAGVVKGINQGDYDKVNVEGAVNLCKALVEKNPSIKRVIMTSSIAAAGPSTEGKIFCEDDPAKPLQEDKYGISKYGMECAIQPYFNTLPIVIVRPPTVIGPGDEPSLDLFKTVKKGYKVIIGRKKTAFSIVSVDDLCDGLYACAVHSAAVHETFYFCSGDPIDWGELQDLIATEVYERKKKLRAISIPKKLAISLGSTMEFFGKLAHKSVFLNKSKMVEGSAGYWAFSCEKAKNKLGWIPKDTVASAVKKAGEWYLRNGWI